MRKVSGLISREERTSRFGTRNEPKRKQSPPVRADFVMKRAMNE